MNNLIVILLIAIFLFVFGIFYVFRKMQKLSDRGEVINITAFPPSGTMSKFVIFLDFIAIGYFGDIYK